MCVQVTLPSVGGRVWRVRASTHSIMGNWLLQAGSDRVSSVAAGGTVSPLELQSSVRLPASCSPRCPKDHTDCSGTRFTRICPQPDTQTQIKLLALYSFKFAVYSRRPSMDIGIWLQWHRTVDFSKYSHDSRLRDDPMVYRAAPEGRSVAVFVPRPASRQRVAWTAAQSIRLRYSSCFCLIVSLSTFSRRVAFLK